MSYSIKKELDLEFNNAVETVKNTLKQQSFSVLTEINVKNTLKERLNINYDNYIILGVCNPSFAYQALQAEKEIGLLLPCNIIIYTENNKTVVSAIKPTEAMSFVENPRLKEVAEQVEEKLRKVINNLKIKNKDN